MTILSRLFNGVRALWTRRRDDDELNEELHGYVEAATADAGRPASNPSRH